MLHRCDQNKLHWYATFCHRKLHSVSFSYILYFLLYYQAKTSNRNRCEISKRIEVWFTLIWFSCISFKFRISLLANIIDYSCYTLRSTTITRFYIIETARYYKMFSRYYVKYFIIHTFLWVSCSIHEYFLNCFRTFDYGDPTTRTTHIETQWGWIFMNIFITLVVFTFLCFDIAEYKDITMNFTIALGSLFFILSIITLIIANNYTQPVLLHSKIEHIKDPTVLSQNSIVAQFCIVISSCFSFG